MEQEQEQTNISVKNITAGISWGQLLIVALTTILTISGLSLQFWKNTDNRINLLEVRMTAQENNDNKINIKLDKVIDGIDGVKENVYDLRLSLKDKQDRK